MGRSTGRAEKLLVLSSVGALVFALGTVLADCVVGPCLVLTFGVGLRVVAGHELVVPLVVQAGCLYAAGRVAGSLTCRYGRLAWGWRAIQLNPLAALLAFALLSFAYGVERGPGPPLYQLLGTDASNLLWIGVTMLTALVPIAQGLALGRSGPRDRTVGEAPSR